MMLKRELPIFMVVGLITIAIDFSIYLYLIYPLSLNHNLAKGISFIGGTIFSYFANRFWTFNQQITGSGSIKRFIFVYSISITANIIMNTLCISWFAHLSLIPKYIILFSFLLATGLSATLNFFGMKFYVFTECQRHE